MYWHRFPFLRTSVRILVMLLAHKTKKIRPWKSTSPCRERNHFGWHFHSFLSELTMFISERWGNIAGSVARQKVSICRSFFPWHSYNFCDHKFWRIGLLTKIQSTIIQFINGHSDDVKVKLLHTLVFCGHWSEAIIKEIHHSNLA